MYNLIVSANPDSFEGEHFSLELGRSVREYTEEAITAQYGAVDAPAVAALLQLPTLFAYENGNSKAPSFGRLPSHNFQNSRSVGSEKIAKDRDEEQLATPSCHLPNSELLSRSTLCELLN